MTWWPSDSAPRPRTSDRRSSSSAGSSGNFSCTQRSYGCGPRSSAGGRCSSRSCACGPDSSARSPCSFAGGSCICACGLVAQLLLLE
eukprot:7423728-Pyramimonas_sp.AAC.1